MTSFTKNLMLAAAACAIAAGNAAAQTYEAHIPFTFRAGQSVMAPGHYQISLGNGSSRAIVRVRNTDSHETIMLVAASVSGFSEEARTAKLRFECGNSRCALASMWVGGYDGAYNFHKPRLGRDEMARVEVVGLTRVKGD
jgi:hypothetical protein